MKKFLSLMLAVGLCLAVLSGCGGANDGGDTNANDAGETKGKVTIGYVNWADDVAMTNLAAVILEDKMGYEVELTMADAAPIYTSLAAGNTDVFLDAWLPVTHEDYINKYGDKLEDLGIIYNDAILGLVVPSYVEVDSIEDLQANKDLFDGEIVGIDSGAGIMKGAEKAIQEYGLDFKLISGSGPTMTAALKKAIDNNQPIIVTGWTPHWMFGRWDLKVLEDPKNSFGESEQVHVMSRLGLKEDMPEVAELLSNMQFTVDEISDLMGAIEESEADPKDVAREWMNNNPDLINSWLPAQSGE